MVEVILGQSETRQSETNSTKEQETKVDDHVHHTDLDSSSNEDEVPRILNSTAKRAIEPELPARHSKAPRGRERSPKAPEQEM